MEIITQHTLFFCLFFLSVSMFLLLNDGGVMVKCLTTSSFLKCIIYTHMTSHKIY